VAKGEALIIVKLHMGFYLILSTRLPSIRVFKPDWLTNCTPWEIWNRQT